MPSPQNFIADQSLCLLMTIHLWRCPEEITDDFDEFLHALAESLSDEDFDYLHNHFA